MATPPATASSTSSTNKEFSIREDELLCSAWIEICTNPLLNIRDTSDEKFWSRVHAAFMTQVQDEVDAVVERSVEDLTERWNFIDFEVMTFSRTYDIVRSNEKKEQSDTERVSEAKFIFKVAEGCKFNLEHCWQILRSEPRWGFPFTETKEWAKGPKRPRRVSDDEPNEQLQVNNKRSKRKSTKAENSGKQEKKTRQVDEDDTLYKIRLERLKLEKEQLKLEEKRLKFQRDMMDLDVLKMDLTGMDDMARKYFTLRKKQAKERISASLEKMRAGQSNEDI